VGKKDFGDERWGERWKGPLRIAAVRKIHRMKSKKKEVPRKGLKIKKEKRVL